jgi:thiamine pyrophosphate-dependent acetolactate synthase large subunit-like protein
MGKQWAHFDIHTDLSFGKPKWASLADAFDWYYQTTSKSTELQPVIKMVADHKDPSLIVILIDYSKN